MSTPPGADAAQWLTGAAAAAAVTGAWGWARTHLKLVQARKIAEAAAPADLATAYASFAKTLNEQAEAFIRALQAERSDLVRRLAEMASEIAALRVEHENCLGDNRNLHQRIDGLEGRLARAGLDIPGRELSGSFMTIEAGKATILKPTTEKPS